jgi:hypothetical protein
VWHNYAFVRLRQYLACQLVRYIMELLHKPRLPSSCQFALQHIHHHNACMCGATLCAVHRVRQHRRQFVEALTRLPCPSGFRAPPHLGARTTWSWSQWVHAPAVCRCASCRAWVQRGQRNRTCMCSILSISHIFGCAHTCACVPMATPRHHHCLTLHHWPTSAAQRADPAALEWDPAAATAGAAYHASWERQ